MKTPHSNSMYSYDIPFSQRVQNFNPFQINSPDNCLFKNSNRLFNTSVKKSDSNSNIVEDFRLGRNSNLSQSRKSFHKIFNRSNNLSGQFNNSQTNPNFKRIDSLNKSLLESLSVHDFEKNKIFFQNTFKNPLNKSNNEFQRNIINERSEDWTKDNLRSNSYSVRNKEDSLERNLSDFSIDKFTKELNFSLFKQEPVQKLSRFENSTNNHRGYIEEKDEKVLEYDPHLDLSMNSKNEKVGGNYNIQINCKNKNKITFTGPIAKFGHQKYIKINKVSNPKHKLTIPDFSAFKQIQKYTSKHLPKNTKPSGIDNHNQNTNIKINKSHQSELIPINSINWFDLPIKPPQDPDQTLLINKPIIKKPKRKRIRKLKPATHCSCKKSKCSRLHCICFSKGKFCSKKCKCNNCFNFPKNAAAINRLKEITKVINPGAFDKKTSMAQDSETGQLIEVFDKGCACKKNSCVQNYCECYRLKVPCTPICQCQGCCNKKIFLSNSEVKKIFKKSSRRKQKFDVKIEKEVSIIKHINS